MQNNTAEKMTNDNKQWPTPYRETTKRSYGEAIRDGYAYLLSEHKNVFVIGQGVWSPWYAGMSMAKLELEFGKERVIDTPVSEAATTGVAVGASLAGYRPVVFHPRIDFMLLAVDAIVNQAAKWRHMLGGQQSPMMTVRGSINRGGEQGAQHSQALHSWFAHVPGLKVVMPSTPQDARDLLIAATLCDDPVLYIDDRWLYDEQADLPPARDIDLNDIKPQILREGSDVTLVGCGYATRLAQQAAEILADEHDMQADVIDLRILNPLDVSSIVASVKKTGRLCVVDDGWTNCGMAGEIIASVTERLALADWKTKPSRVTLTDAPAPSSKVLEKIYYPTCETVVLSVLNQE